MHSTIIRMAYMSATIDLCCSVADAIFYRSFSSEESGRPLKFVKRGAQEYQPRRGHFHKIYRVGAVGLFHCNYTFKIKISVCEIWGNFVEKLLFCQ